MARIKKQLLTEKQQIEASEQARKLRLQKKFGKKVQQDVLDARQRQKREALDLVARHRCAAKKKIKKEARRSIEEKERKKKRMMEEEQER